MLRHFAAHWSCCCCNLSKLVGSPCLCLAAGHGSRRRWFGIVVDFLVGLSVVFWSKASSRSCSGKLQIGLKLVVSAGHVIRPLLHCQGVMVLRGPPTVKVHVGSVSWNMTALQLIGSVSHLGALLRIGEVSSDHYWFSPVSINRSGFLGDQLLWLLSCLFSVSFRNAAASTGWFQRLCTVSSVLFFGQLSRW